MKALSKQHWQKNQKALIKFDRTKKFKKYTYSFVLLYIFMVSDNCGTKGCKIKYTG